MKTTVEQDLLEIKHAKIHILMLNEKNAELCKVNDDEITRLSKVIEGRETLMEGKLKTSGEKKIETSAGYVSFNKMPDKWSYNEGQFIEWAKEDVLRQNTYVKTTTIEEVRKNQLKADVKEGYLKIGDIPGLTITPQNPKFTYKLKGGLL